MSFNIDLLADLLSRWISIDSVNPWLIPGASGEGAIGRALVEWLQPIGVSLAVDEVVPGRSNVVAWLPGTGGGKSLCLNAHMDTVGCAEWPEHAYVPRIQGDRLFGLGAADDKGHCTVALLVLKSLAERRWRPRGNFLVACTIDEEGTSIGTTDLVRRHRMDAAIILEPKVLGKVVVTHQGFGWIDIVVQGRAAHGNAPEQGIDAIVYMAEVIQRLHRLDIETFERTPHPLNGKTVFHTGIIAGGTNYATYPDRCTLGIEIGTQSGEVLAERVREIDQIFNEVREIYPDFKGALEVRLEQVPFMTCGHEDLWQAISSATEAVLSHPPEPAGMNAWTDAALMQEAGIPTLLMGAQGGNLHSPDEWVSLSELTKLGEILEKTVIAYCG